MAHNPADEEDLVQVGLFAFHRELTRNVVAENPYAHARTVIQRAMWRYYGTNSARFYDQNVVPLMSGVQDREGTGDRSANTENLDVRRGFAVMAFASLDGSIVGQEQADLFELDDYFAAIERTCGPTARMMVANLIAPSGECGRRIVAEARRKQEIQEQLKDIPASERRHQPRGARYEVRLSQRIVRDALGLSASEWNRNMASIKAFTLAWLGQ